MFQGRPHLSYSIKALKLEQEDPPQLFNQSLEWSLIEAACRNAEDLPAACRNQTKTPFKKI
jgi:hypothetical protein